MPVQGSGDQFLPGTGLPGHQNGSIGMGQFADRSEDFLHGRSLPDDFRHPLDRFFNDGFPFILLHGPFDEIDCLVEIERFCQILECAPLKCGYGRIEIGIGGHDNDGQMWETFPCHFQQMEAGCPWHAYIRHQHLRNFFLQCHQNVIGTGKGSQRDIFTRERFFQYPANGIVVICNPD